MIGCMIVLHVLHCLVDRCSVVLYYLTTTIPTIVLVREMVSQ